MSPAKRNSGASAPDAAPPQHIAETVPPQSSHDFYAQHTLTMVTTMQASIGALTANVLTMTAALDALKSELKVDVKDLKTELRGDVKDLKTELKDEIKGVKAKVEDLTGLKNKILGGAAAISFLIAIVLGVFKYVDFSNSKHDDQKASLQVVATPAAASSAQTTPPAPLGQVPAKGKENSTANKAEQPSSSR